MIHFVSGPASRHRTKTHEGCAGCACFPLQDTAGTSGLDFLEKVDELLPACVHKQVNSKRFLG